MTASDINLAVLFHGCQFLLDCLEPRWAGGVGGANEQLKAVYASHERNFGILFALPIQPNENGNWAWRVDDFDPTNPQVIIQAGFIDYERSGFLYTLPAAGFEAIDDLQWVSLSPVKPIHREIIMPSLYKNWVRYDPER